MSDIEQAPENLDLLRGEADLSRATAELRDAPPPPQATASRVRRIAHATPRRTQLVRVAEPRSHVQVSTSAITATLHDHLAPALRDAAVRRILIVVGPDRALRSLTVELVVRYGVPVADSASAAHEVIESTLDELMGSERPSGPEIGQIRVIDVTTGDPRAVDPADER